MVLGVLLIVMMTFCSLAAPQVGETDGARAEVPGESKELEREDEGALKHRGRTRTQMWFTARKNTKTEDTRTGYGKGARNSDPCQQRIPFLQFSFLSFSFVYILPVGTLKPILRRTNISEAAGWTTGDDNSVRMRCILTLGSRGYSLSESWGRKYERRLRLAPSPPPLVFSAPVLRERVTSGTQGSVSWDTTERRI